MKTIINDVTGRQYHIRPEIGSHARWDIVHADASILRRGYDIYEKRLSLELKARGIKNQNKARRYIYTRIGDLLQKDHPDWMEPLYKAVVDAFLEKWTGPGEVFNPDQLPSEQIDSVGLKTLSDAICSLKIFDKNCSASILEKQFLKEGFPDECRC